LVTLRLILIKNSFFPFIYKFFSHPETHFSQKPSLSVLSTYKVFGHPVFQFNFNLSFHCRFWSPRFSTGKSFFFSKGISDAIPHRLLLQAGRNTTMITRHHPHHLHTLSLEHLSTGKSLLPCCFAQHLEIFRAIAMRHLQVLQDRL
jgi:hypothetical protein